MTVPESRARRYGRERAYKQLVQPVPKVDKQKISKEEFRKLMQRVKEESMKRNWTRDSARAYITKAKAGRVPFGLTFCSACDFLKVPVWFEKPDSQKISKEQFRKLMQRTKEDTP